MSFDTKEEEVSKEDHVKNYIKIFDAIENAMEPFKEQKKDLREEYSENGWLSKQEIRLAVKAYRLVKSDTDMEELAEYFNKLKKTVGVLNV